jgi:hypothetical protein
MQWLVKNSGKSFLDFIFLKWKWTCVPQAAERSDPRGAATQLDDFRGDVLSTCLRGREGDKWNGKNQKAHFPADRRAHRCERGR